ncbi:sugar transporter SWEET1-like [Adelges cooleyi]|uniref:sugar transporter SWEET1-like n=1 Tax=Adelges cooleyi TaxID=133065 RepID=UPI00217FCB8D|nr:sugar transporter SWEET1-like [Adelges cooleyi]
MYDIYVKSVSFTAGCASTMLILTPLLVCKDIVRKKSSDHVNLSSFTGALFRSSLFVRQGYLLNLYTIMFVHGMGLVFNMFYLMVYLYYSTDKNKVMKKTLKLAVISSILLLYSVVESKDVVTVRYSAIVTVIHLLIIGWPLLSLRETIKTKRWSGHPKPILINTMVVCLLWLLYSINVKNNIMFMQCFVGFTLSLIQLKLLFIYPIENNAHHKSEKDK